MTTLYADNWLVTDGVWQLLPEGAVLAEPPDDTDALLATVGSVAVVISGPAMYGNYPVQVVQELGEPAIPDWCEDVCETSIEVGAHPLVLASLETFSDPMHLPAGGCRVRLCAAGLDVAAQQSADDEFDGDDYRTYDCRVLLQLWSAPAGETQTVRAGSAFARSLS